MMSGFMATSVGTMMALQVGTIFMATSLADHWLQGWRRQRSDGRLVTRQRHETNFGEKFSDFGRLKNNGPEACIPFLPAWSQAKRMLFWNCPNYGYSVFAD